MSSREIAEFTEKRHDNVMRDIRLMLNGMGEAHLKYEGSYRDTSGRMCKCFRLDRYHTEVLVTSYDVKRMSAVIKRWMDLETGAAKPAAALLGKISSRP